MVLKSIGLMAKEVLQSNLLVGEPNLLLMTEILTTKLISNVTEEFTLFRASSIWFMVLVAIVLYFGLIFVRSKDSYRAALIKGSLPLGVSVLLYSIQFLGDSLYVLAVRELIVIFSIGSIVSLFRFLGGKLKNKEKSNQ